MIIGHAASLDIVFSGGRPTRAVFLDPSDDEIGSIEPSHTHQPGFLGGFGVARFEVSASTSAGGFEWRLFSVRQGFRSGLRLSLVATDALAEQAAGDPLWTVGTLGREHMPTPYPEKRPDDPDPRTLFLHGDGDRILIEDDGRELWGTLESATMSGRWTLRRWDGRFLGHLDQEALDGAGCACELTASESLEDALEAAALEAIGIARLVLSE